MIGRGGLTVDNRDSAQMYDYLEARIDVLTRRVRELEAENRTLRYPRVAKIQSALPQVPTAELAKRIAG